MGDELQKRLLSYLDAAEKGIREAGPVVGGELEALVREWLTWMFIERVGLAVLFVALASVTVVMTTWAWRAAGRLDSMDRPPARAVWAVLGTLAAIGLAAGGGHWALQAVKVRVAPRVVVLEEVARLVKPVAPK